MCIDCKVPLSKTRILYIYVGFTNVFFTDDPQGPPNTTVDIQRNRIIATAALKKAEPLADQGKSRLTD